jgi:DedD protein
MTEAYKDKIEVSLDGRQIFYLFFGGSVIVGLVFVLGVMVGRRVEARGHVDRAQSSAAVDPLTALDRLEGNGGLSFRGALTGATHAGGDVEKTIADIEKARVAKPIDKSIDKPADKSIDKPADKPAAAPAAKPADKPAIADKVAAADKPADADKPVTKPEPKAADAAKPVDKDKVKAKFTLQLSSFQDKGEAEAFLSSVNANGLQAYLTQGEVDGKQYYRIRIGSFRTLDAANDAKAEVEKTTKKSAVVTKL